MTRTGKIARLPRLIRDALNRRLDDGVTGKSIVAWLNRLPEVRALIANEFGGHPIREQNLSHWKSGGYRDWCDQQQALEFAGRLAENSGELSTTNSRPMSEVLTLWLAARYSIATRQVADTTGEEGWKLLRQMCNDVLKIRRSDQNAERLEIERDRVRVDRERLALERARHGSESWEESEAERPWSEWSDEERIAWARHPDNFERISSYELAPEVEGKRWDRVMARETDADRASHAKLRAFIQEISEDPEHEWTDEDKIDWCRLPENLDRIFAKDDMSPEESARGIRRVLGAGTEADKAYYAARRAEKEAAAREEHEDEETEDEEQEKEVQAENEEEPFDVERTMREMDEADRARRARGIAHLRPGEIDEL